ncbi:hypothetical protein GW17_00057830 [Ensete ventricosum]|nr:hypothetical protein GW17_00057830 [Ensete ventricosum]
MRLGLLGRLGPYCLVKSSMATIGWQLMARPRASSRAIGQAIKIYRAPSGVLSFGIRATFLLPCSHLSRLHLPKQLP